MRKQAKFLMCFLLFWQEAQFVSITTSLYHSETTMAVIEVDHMGNLVSCHLYELNEYSKKQPIISSWSSAGLDVRKLKFVDMVDLIIKCQDVPSGLGLNLGEHKSKEVKKLIKLGVANLGVVLDTKWCGFGQATLDYSQLGSDKELDKCCRAHDHCPVQSRGLTEDNPYLYTQCHCLCDQKFYQCLKNVGSPTADTIGQIFFNIVRMKCLSFAEVTQKCEVSMWGRCLEWEETEQLARVVVTENNLNY